MTRAPFGAAGREAATLLIIVVGAFDVRRVTIIGDDGDDNDDDDDNGDDGGGDLDLGSDDGFDIGTAEAEICSNI